MASVISVGDNGLALIVRETFQDPSQADQLSFPSRGLESLKPYVSEKLLRQRLEYEEEAEEPEFATGEEEGEEETAPESSEEAEEGEEEDNA